MFIMGLRKVQFILVSSKQDVQSFVKLVSKSYETQIHIGMNRKHLKFPLPDETKGPEGIMAVSILFCPALPSFYAIYLIKNDKMK